MDRYVLNERREAVRSDDRDATDAYYENNDLRRVGRTQVGPYDVSTVFLVFDHRFGAGPPQLFETMVFGPAGEEDEIERCSTWAEAEAMHARWVKSCEARIMRTPPRTPDEHGG